MDELLIEYAVIGAIVVCMAVILVKTGVVESSSKPNKPVFFTCIGICILAGSFLFFKY